MDQPRKPIITEHRRKRLTLWALTVLGWIADVLYGDRDTNHRHLAQRLHHICLDQLKRVAVALLVTRAIQYAKARTPRRLHYWKHGRSLLRTHFMRSLLGARFRRLLRHSDLRERIARLAALLRNLDTHARQFAHRFRQLRRLWRVMPPIGPAEVLYGAPASPPGFSDSS